MRLYWNAGQGILKHGFEPAGLVLVKDECDSDLSLLSCLGHGCENAREARWVEVISQPRSGCPFGPGPHQKGRPLGGLVEEGAPRGAPGVDQKGMS